MNGITDEAYIFLFNILAPGTTKKETINCIDLQRMIPYIVVQSRVKLVFHQLALKWTVFLRNCGMTIWKKLHNDLQPPLEGQPPLYIAWLTAVSMDK